MGYELLIARFLSSITSDAVTSQSVTVGCFLLSLGFGAYLSHRLGDKTPWKILTDVEIGVSFLAAVSLPILAIISLFMVKPLSFIAITQIATFLIGTLSGLELPALIAAARPYSKRAFGWVLAANYVGTLIVSFLLPTYFLPQFGLYLTSWIFAVLTSLAAVLAFFRHFDFRPHFRYLGLLIIFLAPPYLASHRDQFEQFYLKSFYIAGPAGVSPHEFELALEMQKTVPRVQRFATPYQDIDIVSNNSFGYENQGLVKDFHLFIDQRNQFGSDSEIIYHDTMVHGSINIAKRIPHRVLVIGGGDGFIARHLLTYPEIESITQVELDPKMIELSNTFRPLKNLNHGSLQNPRVHVEIADGFSWLRQSRETFDAIFIDLPHPVSVDLSRLYSVEFYRFVRARLNSTGFMCFDFPFDALVYLGQSKPKNLEPIRAILKAVDEAGFGSRIAFGSWESFLLATPEKKSLDFDYGKLGEKIAPRSTLNMAAVRLPNVEVGTPANSIFKPVTIEVRSIRGN
jgi:spermidine synthase